MLMSQAKRGTLLLVVLWVCLCFVGDSLADPLTEAGQIAVIVHGEKDIPLPGATVTIFRVGSVSMDHDTMQFSPASIFAEDGLTFENVTSTRNLDLADLLAKKVKIKKIRGLSATTNQMGRVVYGNVRPGVYLIVQTGAKFQAGKYEYMSPFLAFVPLMDPASGTWIKHVNVYPKMTKIGSNKRTGPKQRGKRPRLPRTGELIWPTYALAGSGLLLFATGFWLSRRRRKDEVNQ